MRGRKTAQLTWRARWATMSHAIRSRRLLLPGCLLLAVLLSASSWTVFRLMRRDTIDWQHANVHMLVPTDVTRWLDDGATHQANNISYPDQHVDIDPAFAAYYTAHAGTTLLGTPLTTAFPTADGTVQFFSLGALLLPTGATGTSSTALAESVARILPQDDMRDTSTGIVRLALLPRLLTSGSEMPIGGIGSSMTYVGLRRAAQPDKLVRKPSASNVSQASAREFIPEAVVNGTVRGHFIPQDIWTYVTRPDVSPDGWQTDFGAPLTEAVAFTMQRDGKTVQAQVQAFVREVVIAYPGAYGQLTMEPADLGNAYLDTLGPPPLAQRGQSSLWATQDTSVRSAPGSDTVQAHVGRDFALTWAGEGSWVDGGLWYHVQWQNPQAMRDGWVPAMSVTFSSPGAVPGYAEFDALSPDLEAYLTHLGGATGAAVYDLTRGRYYTYNADTQFIMASSAKVPIMLTLLSMVEQQKRQPTGDEVNLLTAMIENSDNDAAQALFDEIGGAGPMDSFMRGVGIAGFAANADGWGYSTITPLAMVRLLTLLHDGSVLNSAQDRQLALSLMQNVESDQQVGVGDTAPAHATVALKDGWVQDPDGLWAVNTSGIVTVGGETYIISVYTQRQDALDASQDMMRHVCGAVAQSLAPA